MENSGSGEATNVEIRSPLPEHTTFVSATDGGVFQQRLTDSRREDVYGIIIWNIGAIYPGASEQVEFIVEVDSPLKNGTLITNRATIKSDQTPEMQVTATAEVKSAPILSLEKKVDSPSPTPLSNLWRGAGGEVLQGGGDYVEPGDIITYTFTYKNTGNDIAKDVVLSDVLPEALQYIDGGTYDESSRTVQWKIGDLKPDPGERNISFRAKVKENLESGLYEIQNIGMMAASELEAIESNPVYTSILAPYVRLTKMGNKRIAEIGDIITYTLTVTNLSPNSDLFDVTVKDILPRGFDYLEGTGLIDERTKIEPTTEGMKNIFKISHIPKGKSVNIIYSTSVGANADLGDGINKAQAYYTTEKDVNTKSQLKSNQAEWQVQVRKGFFCRKRHNYGENLHR